MEKLRCYNCYYEWEAIPEEVIDCPYCGSLEWNNPDTKGTVIINGEHYRGLDNVITALKELGVRIKEDAPRYTIRTKKTTSVGMSQ